LKLTPRRVQQLVAEGLPKVARGRYDLDEVLDWYIARLERRLAGEIDEDGQLEQTTKAELRLLSARADLRELELATRRREFIAIADVEKHMTDLVITTKARVMAVPARVAGELVGETSRVMAQAKIEKGIKEALSHLAGSRC
jgi:phage terminase Nu1 subunit (DNA packaging protein)